MRIHIEALTFEVIIGLLDFERERPQKVIIDIGIEYDYCQNDFIDYADIVALLQKDLHTKRYELLEDALLGIKERLLSSFPQSKTLMLKIAKPDILPECSVALSETWNFKT